MDKTSLGNRMKGYEAVTNTVLTKRTPVILRIDGRSFHTLTRKLDKPFDMEFVSLMGRTLKYLCENVQGCVLGYTQSDEISLVLCDYQKLTTSAWFDYRVSKVVSTSAAMASVAFNSYLGELLLEEINFSALMASKRVEILEKALNSLPTFDSRAFNLPKEEVNNYLVWRQDDAIRNSIQSCGQHFFSAKELHGVKCDEIITKLLEERSFDWEDLPTRLKRGTVCVKGYDGEWEISSAPNFKTSTVVKDLINFD